MKRAWIPPLAVAMGFTLAARAQPTSKPRAPSASAVPATSAPTNLRAHVGTDYAARLLRSTDPDERLRGIERAAAIGTPEAIAMLVESLERSPQTRSDSRTLLAKARGLARFAQQERARVGLLAIVGAGPPGPADASDEGDPVARAELARDVAAIALARSGGDRALEALYGAARGGGHGQNAAIVALTMTPPRDPGFFGTSGMSMPVAVVRMLGQLGDLRALDVLHGAARSTDVGVRCAALIALAELGDARASLLARTAIAESDVRLRAAAGEVFIKLGAPERFKATSALIADEATTRIGLQMAERVFNPEITKLVAERAIANPDRELRLAALRALGRSPDPNAAKSLVAPELLGDRELAYHAVLALARSPAPNAGALIASQTGGRQATLFVRAYVVRALVRGERNGTSDDGVSRLTRSRVATDRALGVMAQVALGDADLDAFLNDKDPHIRRAAVLATLSRPSTRGNEHILLARLAREDDPTTRQLLAVGLLGGDPAGLVKTSTLEDRAASGGGDAPLAAFALARRADETTSRRIGQLLRSKDGVLRAHAARGLGLSSLPDAAGRLAEMYASETDAEVRRAVVAALAARTSDAKAPARRTTLENAAELDPDGPTRLAAARALAGTTLPFLPPATQEVAWLRITKDDGGAPGEPFVGAIVRADGIAVPLLFDEEGHALAFGLPPGEARVALAPRLPTYKESPTP